MENIGFDALALRYNTQLTNLRGFGIVRHAPMLTPEEWAQQLWDSYDYVALYRFDDFFLENYSAIFEDPADLRWDTLYRVDAGQRKLIRCE